jgi:hypothetical protein
MDFDDRPVHEGHVAFGAVIMTLGLIFLMDRMDIITPATLALYWPGLLVVFGMTRIMWPSRPGAEVGGTWIALAGGLLLLDRIDVIEMRESWPVFLIVGGLVVMFRALDWLPDRNHARDEIVRGTRQ